jgi:hypothetical protein
MAQTFTNSQGLTIDFDPTAKLDIEIRTNHWSSVTADIFRSWAGNRKINDRPYAGPVYYLWSNEISTPIEQLQTAQP